MRAEWLLGTALFWAMPTTTSTGVLIVGEAGGTVSLALALSVLSNVAAVFTAPLFVAGIFAGGATLGVGELLARLALTVLLPLAAGKAARAWPPVLVLAARYRTQTRLLSSALLIAVPWMLMSASAATLRATPTADLLALVGICAAAHAALLAANVALAAVLPAAAASPPERVAIAIMGSQKTINLAAAVILALPPGYDAGLIVLPCIVSHFCQTIIDSLLGAAWGRRQRNRASSGSAAASAAAAAAAAPGDMAAAPPLRPPGLLRKAEEATAAAPAAAAQPPPPPVPDLERAREGAGAILLADASATSVDERTLAPG